MPMRNVTLTSKDIDDLLQRFASADDQLLQSLCLWLLGERERRIKSGRKGGRPRKSLINRG